jgi:chromosome segregation protein
LASLRTITNFNVDEFKALRKRARKEGIGLLPGVELSVNDGSNGVHTLIVFSDEWIEEGQDYINQFLGNAFTGKAKTQYEQENGRTNENLLETLKKLEAYNKGFFVLFAHVEAPSGLWAELEGGRLTDLSQHPLIQKCCLGFQKVRTHDKPEAKCRKKVQQWWAKYPAEVEGSDPKKVDEIGRGQKCFVKLGDVTFDAVKFALTDFPFRVAKGDWYCFERGATKTAGGEGWADVWMRNHFGWEYKGKRKTKLLNSQNDRLWNSQSSLSSHHGVGALTIAL